jgi:recombinational DNA repair protein (RecF pathway)
VEPLARYFEFWLLRLQGVYPSIGRCQECGASLEAAGGARLASGDESFSCAACRPGRGRGTLSGEALGFLRAARHRAPAAMATVAVGAAALAELEAVHQVLVSRHLERELKSTRVVRDFRRLAAGRPARAADARR